MFIFKKFLDLLFYRFFLCIYLPWETSIRFNQGKYHTAIFKIALKSTYSDHNLVFTKQETVKLLQIGYATVKFSCFVSESVFTQVSRTIYII